MKPRVENGEPVPDVSRREMKTFDVIVDEAMEGMGRGTLDLANDADRERFRGWLRAFVRHAAHDMQWAFTRATESAMVQAAALMNDPQKYERQRATNAKRRAEFKADRERQLREMEERKQERTAFIKQLADEGKVLPMPGLTFDIPCCTGKEEPPKPEGDGA